MKVPEPLLLDTHAWYWLVTGHERLKGVANLRKIEQAAEAGDLHLSVISVWEIAMLEAKGRLELGRRCESWVSEAVQKSHVRLAPLDPSVAILSTRLEKFPYGDPADRILAATSIDKGWRLVTSDRRLIHYLETRKMPVMSL